MFLLFHSAEFPSVLGLLCFFFRTFSVLLFLLLLNIYASNRDHRKPKVYLHYIKVSLTGLCDKKIPNKNFEKVYAMLSVDSTLKGEFKKRHDVERRHQLVKEKLWLYHHIAFFSDASKNVEQERNQVLIATKGFEAVDALLDDLQS